MFIRDRDLLQFEPELFVEAVLAGQTLAEETGSISGGVLTAAGLTAEREVRAGHVVVMGRRATLEVLERVSATQARVSLVRAGASGAQIVPYDVVDVGIRVTTFEPQIASAHAQLMAMIGVDLEVIGSGGLGRVATVTNPGELARLEAMLTLELVFSAIASVRSAGDAWAARAEMYARRARLERQRARAQLDTNGDGVPDVVRALNRFELGR